MANRTTKGDKQIADFAKTVVDSAAVCATKDTAGGHGIDVCMCLAGARTPATISLGPHAREHATCSAL